MRSILAKLTIVAAACVAVFLLLGTLLIHPSRVQAAIAAPNPGIVPMQLGRHTMPSRGPNCGPPSLAPQTSMLLAKDKIWIGLTIFWPSENKYEHESEQYRWKISNVDGEYDWQAAGRTLAEIRLNIQEYETTRDDDRWPGLTPDIEIAAEDEVQYGQLVAAMDLAVAHEFRDFSVLDNRQLTHWFLE